MTNSPGRRAHRPLLRLGLLALVTFGLGCASDAPPPEPLKVGSRVSAVTLLDQNDVPHKIDSSARIIFFAREMEGGAVIQKLLAEEGPDYLAKHRALYVADISEMPTLIAKLVAIPTMKAERPYPTLLDRDGKATAAFPSEEGRVTILGLDKLRVIAIHYRGSVAGLREAVGRIR